MTAKPQEPKTIEVRVEGATFIVEAFGSDGGSSALPVVTLSRHGLFVRSEWFLWKDVELPFTLQLAGEAPLVGKARVRWARMAAAGPALPPGLALELVEFAADGQYQYLRYLENCLLNLKVADLMSSGVLAVQASDTVKKAVSVMRRAKIGSVIVKGADDTLLGILTERDLLRLFGNHDAEQETVATHMTGNVVHVSSQAPAEAAYKILLQGRFRHLPVVDDGKIVAMVSVRDLLPYWSELMDLSRRRLKRDNDRAMHLIVHDLRSPIAVVRSLVQLMEDTTDGVANFMALDGVVAVDQSCDKMLRLIDELLELPATPDAALRIVPEPADLAHLVQQAVRRFQALGQLKGITVASDVETGLPLVPIDPLRISQLLDNLISNALKFSPAGAIVTLGLHREADALRLTVSDNGQGIPAEELPRLFREQGKTSVRPTAGEASSGLGLAIAKKIVEAHRGRVSVTSELGRGTTFVVRLPLELKGAA